MFSTNDIDLYLRQMVKDKNKPQTFVNSELAPAVYKAVKEKYPNAAMYEEGKMANICLTKCAKRKVLKWYLVRREEQERKLKCINRMIDRIKEEIS